MKCITTPELNSSLGEDRYFCGAIKQMLEAHARLGYAAVFVYDLPAKRIIHAHVLSILLKEVLGDSLEVLQRHLEHVDNIVCVGRQALRFFRSIKSAQRSEMKLSFNFSLNKVVCLNLQITPLYLDADNRMIRWVLCSISHSTVDDLNCYIRHRGTGQIFRYNSLKGCFNEGTPKTLSTQEVKVILLCARGKKTAEIADLLHKSAETIKGYKSEIITKLGVKNMTEAVSFALKHHLI